MFCICWRLTEVACIAEVDPPVAENDQVDSGGPPVEPQMCEKAQSEGSISVKRKYIYIMQVVQLFKTRWQLSAKMYFILS